MRGRKKKPPLLSDHLGGELAAQAFSNELIPGRVLGLWYDNDDKYHEFLLLYPGPGTGWAGLTPDGDRLEEKVMCDDPGNSCSRAFVCDDMGNGPPEARGKFYRFGDYPSDDAFKDHLKRARAEMRADALTQGLDAPADPKEALTLLGEKVDYHTLVPRRGGGAVGKAAAKPKSKAAVKATKKKEDTADDEAEAVVDDSEKDDDTGDAPSAPAAGGAAKGVWRAIEEVGGLKPGDVAPAPALATVRGVRGVSTLASGAHVFVRKDEWTDREQFLEKVITELSKGDADARVISVKSGPRGRHRTFQDYIDAINQEDFPDFPVTGPRTAGWCLEFLRKRHNPSDHHLTFRTTARLQSDQWGVQEHEHLMKLVEFGATYDQVDLSNLAMGEAIFRRAQTIEWAYHDKLRDMESAAPKERLSPEELSAFSGLDRTGDHLMVAPSLLDHVKGVVEKDAAIMKNIRKAKEEREARKGKKEKG